MATVSDVIKKEMAFNNFRPKKIPGVKYDEVVAEIAGCLYATLHEQTIVPTGVVFSKIDLSEIDGVRIEELAGTSACDLRSLADGRRTFLVYAGSPQPRLAVLETAVADEIRLLELADLARGLVIKRDQAGSVRIAQDRNLWLVNNRNWEHKRPVMEHMRLVQQCLGEFPYDLWQPLFSLLRLTYYFLSSHNIGGTLVWRVRGTKQETLKGVSTRGLDLSDLDLNVMDESSYPILEHLLRHNDGATIIGPTGAVEHLGAHLVYGDGTANLIGAEGGTRHTSAKRFAFEHDETVVFVVSQDGPVSIYSDGYKVAEMYSSLASEVSSLLRRLVPAKSEDVYDDILDIQCGNCGRPIRIQAVEVVGWRERVTVDCPCCQAPAIYSSSCWSLSATPIKFI